MSSSFREWILEHLKKILSDPVRGLMHAIFTIYLGFWYTLTSRWPIGTHAYEEEWNLFIILDGCRVDVLESISHEYDFIESVESRWSVGSHSHEWLTQTFTEKHADEIIDTAYISGNGHTHETFVASKYPPDETVPFCSPNWRTVNIDQFGQLDMLWETAHEDELGIPPRAITDRTVEVGRKSDYDRVIAHYMQPHIPYIAGALDENRSPTDVESKGWKLLEAGEGDSEEVWELYKDNLRLVLDEVELLLENIDADNVVVTADHGNAFGEYSIYGHPEGMLLPCIKKVPWIVTEAADGGSFNPSGDYDENIDKTNIEDHLQDLGYL